VARLIEVTTALAGVGASDPEAFLADATEYLEAAGHIVIAWIWLEQVLALGGRADDDSDAFAAGKLRAATYFLQRELPVVDAKFDLLAAGDRTTLDMRDDWF
jgi:butyryl-CoA dehydrogenase